MWSTGFWPTSWWATVTWPLGPIWGWAMLCGRVEPVPMPDWGRDCTGPQAPTTPSPVTGAMTVWMASTAGAKSTKDTAIMLEPSGSGEATTSQRSTSDAAPWKSAIWANVCPPSPLISTVTDVLDPPTPARYAKYRLPKLSNAALGSQHAM